MRSKNSMWRSVFIEPWVTLKWWIVWKLEPWYEERASLALEWRIFAQKHNAAGHRPQCAYRGMEKDFKPTDKLVLYEFPYGPDSKHEPIDPAYLQKAHWDAAKETDKRSQVT